MLKSSLIILFCTFCFTLNAQEAPPKKYKPKIISGAILFPSGIQVLGLTIFAENYEPVMKNFPKIKNPGIALGYSLGGVATVVGAILLGVGLNERNIYSNKNTSVSLICSDRLGFAYKF